VLWNLLRGSANNGLLSGLDTCSLQGPIQILPGRGSSANGKFSGHFVEFSHWLDQSNA